MHTPRIGVVGRNMVDLIAYAPGCRSSARRSKRRASRWGLAAKAPSRRWRRRSSARPSSWVSKVGEHRGARSDQKAPLGPTWPSLSRFSGKSGSTIAKCGIHHHIPTTPPGRGGQRSHRRRPAGRSRSESPAPAKPHGGARRDRGDGCAWRQRPPRRARRSS